MRKLLVWLRTAMLFTLWSATAHAQGTTLKPYVVLILDTSGSMNQPTGSGPPSCGGIDSKIDHARCAINNIANAYGGDMVFAFGKFREFAGGTFATDCNVDCTSTLAVDCTGCDATTGAGCPANGADDSLFQLVTSLEDGNSSQTAAYTNFACNTCAIGPPMPGGNPEVIFANSWTPLNGSFKGDKRYWLGLQATDATVIWPNNLPGFAPIRNDPTNNVFLPSGCNPSPTCTTNCCATQCRPYITIMLTDGDEFCSRIDPLWPTVSTLLRTDVTTGTPASLKRYRVETKAIGFGVPVGYKQIEDIAHAGGAVDVPGVNEGYYASDAAGLQLAISQIIAGSVRSEVCNNLDDDCDTLIDEDFPGKGNVCNNGKQGVCTVNGTLVCRADGTGLTCNAGSVACNGKPLGAACTVTNANNMSVPGTCSAAGTCNPTPQSTCPVGKTCSPDNTETCGDSLDNDCDGIIDEGCTPCVPTAEICNNKDDDCDGLVDEGVTKACGTGACLGIQVCTAGIFGACSAKTPTPEVCNGLDDDCDGIADGFTKTCSNMITPGGPATDNPGDPSHSPIPQNICHPGSKNCPVAPPGTGVFSACTGEQTPQPEICNGLDDDCDNTIDEGFVPQPCSSACGVGMTQCLGGSITCNAQPALTDKTCNNIDDDCDMKIDEDWMCNDPTSTPQAACACGTGVVCNGMAKCVNGTVQCVGDPINVETCNCKDDDCDGIVDEGSTCTGGSTCTNCQCAFPCSPGEFKCPLMKKCVGATPTNPGFCVNDPCYNVTCPDVGGHKQECIENPANTPMCVDVCSQKVGVNACPSPLICIPKTGECGPDDCSSFPERCAANQNCINGTCVTNPCQGVTCAADQYCVGGSCFGSCVGKTCPNGQRCKLGMCEADPCGHPCPFGQACNDATGHCIEDPCLFRQCPVGQWCNPNDGQCEDDPCVGTHCPTPDQVCKGGSCFDPTSFLPDAGVEQHVTVGGGGCNTTGDGSLAGLLIGLALLARRRRRSGGEA